MSVRVLVAKDFDHPSQVAADLVKRDILQTVGTKREYVPGLAKGGSLTGVHKQLAVAFNAGEFDTSRIRSFNLDEYTGLPGENAQQRVMHAESYCH